MHTVISLVIMLKILSHVLSEIYVHAEETYPTECCGFIASLSIDAIIHQAIRCTNVQDSYHKQEPKNFPSTSRKAYIIDPIEELAILQKDMHDYFLRGIYHSHTGFVTDFSPMDRKGAVHNNEPLWPNYHYLIVLVSKGKVNDVKSFIWNSKKKDFIHEIIRI